MKKPNKAQRTELLEKNLPIMHNLFHSRSGIIIGIDSGRNEPGLTIYSPKKKKYTMYSTRTKSKGFGKVIEVENWLKEILGKYKIRVALIEDYAYGRSHHRESTAEMSGVIRRYLWLRNIPLIPVSIQTLKSFIGAKEKNLIIKELYKQYKLDAKNDDEADSAVLAIIGKTMYGAVNEFCTMVSEESISKCETHPHKFCSLKSKHAKIVKDLVVSKTQEAQLYAKANTNKEGRSKKEKNPSKTRKRSKSR